jgi:hypothetical protein
MNLEIIDDNSLESLKNFLRKMRNDVVGSLENKQDYIKNESLYKYH